MAPGLLRWTVLGPVNEQCTVSDTRLTHHLNRQCMVEERPRRVSDTRWSSSQLSIECGQRRGTACFAFEVVWKHHDRFQKFLGERLTYLDRRIDSSTVHLVLRGSTAGSVQKAS